MAEHDWTGGDLPTFVTHLECSLTGERYPADTLQTLSRVGRPLLVRYDLDGVGRALSRVELAARQQMLWRYRELLSVRSQPPFPDGAHLLLPCPPGVTYRLRTMRLATS